MDQSVISTFKLLFKKLFHKAIAAIVDFSDGSGQSKLKPSVKDFPMLEAIKNICDSWKEPKYQQ